MSTNFDQLAFSYDSALTPLPNEYIDLIRRVCNLKPNDQVIDLGCGSGLLTFALSYIGCNVIGVDSSIELIRIAKKRDIEKRINWIVSPVETFTFDVGCVAAILSFEAFHLFPEQDKLVKRFVKELQPGGVLGVGWCTFHWEQLLKEAIVDVFASHGITWGEWGYQRCDHLEMMLWGSCIKHYHVSVEDLFITETTNIERIAQYLSNIDKTASLNLSQRKTLACDLKSRFFRVLMQQSISGNSIYSLAYIRL